MWQCVPAAAGSSTRNHWGCVCCRYQRGCRSLAANLQAQGAAVQSQKREVAAAEVDDDDEEYDIPAEIENVVGVLKLERSCCNGAVGLCPFLLNLNLKFIYKYILYKPSIKLKKILYKSISHMLQIKQMLENDQLGAKKVMWVSVLL